MLNLLKQFLSNYSVEASPIIAPAIFFILLMIIHHLCVVFVTHPLKKLDKDDRKALKKEYRSRAFVGWFFWIMAWATLIVGYFDALPGILMNETVMWGVVGLLMMLNITFHYLAYAQAAIRIINLAKENKASIPVVS